LFCRLSPSELLGYEDALLIACAGDDSRLAEYPCWVVVNVTSDIEAITPENVADE